MGIAGSTLVFQWPGSFIPRDLFRPSATAVLAHYPSQWPSRWAAVPTVPCHKLHTNQCLPIFPLPPDRMEEVSCLLSKWISLHEQGFSRKLVLYHSSIFIFQNFLPGHCCRHTNMFSYLSTYSRPQGIKKATPFSQEVRHPLASYDLEALDPMSPSSLGLSF